MNKALLKNRETVIIAVMTLMSLMIARNLYNQQIKKYMQLKEDIKIEQEKGMALDRIILLNEQIKQAKKKSWDTVDFNSIVDKIFNMALESQIKIRNITPHDPRNEKHYVAIPFSLNAEGTYKDILRFIKKLESYKMMVRVRDLNMSPLESQDTDKSDILLAFGLQVEAFYFK